VDLIRGSATLIHAGMDLIRGGMGTMRGHVGWNCSGVTDDRPPTTAHGLARPSSVRRLCCPTAVRRPRTARELALPSAVLRLTSNVFRLTFLNSTFKIQNYPLPLAFPPCPLCLSGEMFFFSAFGRIGISKMPPTARRGGSRGLSRKTWIPRCRRGW
jgi:hypothetical protein